MLLSPARRQIYIGGLCIGLVYVSALPLVASLIEFAAIGLNRFRIGYEHLRPFYPRVAVVVAAWNEGNVIGATIERLLAMDYPDANVRVYVVDDASTDATPDVVRAWEAREPDRVRHLRREQGGQGKAHTLNHGITQILAEPWAEALLIIDADVLFEPSALRRMARHLSNPKVGAVTAYIKEGSANGNYLTRYIAYEYITAQAAARRAQNVSGAMVCLAGGRSSTRGEPGVDRRCSTAQRSRRTPDDLRTQLSGKRVVFEGNAIVWAEEPAISTGCGSSDCAGRAATCRSRCSSRTCGCTAAATASWAAVALILVHGRVDAALHDGRVERLDRPLPPGPPEGVERIPYVVDLSRRHLRVCHGDVVRAGRRRPGARGCRAFSFPVRSLWRSSFTPSLPGRSARC